MAFEAEATLTRAVELALTRHYLRSDGPSGGAPLRYIDATNPELTRAFEAAELHCANPVDLLVEASGGPATISNVFADGMWGKDPTNETPSIFTFLVFTCAVAAAADSNTHTREFRKNLAGAAGAGLPMSNLAGLPSLWKRLALWAASQRKAGRPFREIVLPDTAGFRLVGVSQRIAFPAWRDLDRLRSLLQHLDKPSIQDPMWVARTVVRKILQDSRYSPAMREASDEYHRLYMAKASLLGVHRLWKAVVAAHDGMNHTSRLSHAKLEAELHLALGADDVYITFHLLKSAAADRTPAVSETLEGPLDLTIPKFKAWLSERRPQHPSDPISVLFDAGMLPFIEARFGVWIGQSNLSSIVETSRLLFERRHRDTVHRVCQEVFEVGERWLVTKPLAVEELRRVARSLGLMRYDAPPPVPEPVITVIGGQRVDGVYLGRPSLLPKLQVPGAGALIAEPVTTCVASLPVEDLGSCWAIQATAPLNGVVRFRFEESIVGFDPLAVERIESFVADCPEHPQIASPDNTRWRAEEEVLCVHLTSQKAGEAAPVPPQDQGIEDPDLFAKFEDLLEAIYAGGRSGWAEGELYALVSEVVGRAGTTWDVIRSLQECDWLYPTSLRAWKARRWWLRQPYLLAVDGATVLRGSASWIVRERFASTAMALNGSVLEFRGLGPLSPTLIQATGVMPERLAKELQWPLRVYQGSICDCAPKCWLPVTEDVSSHEWAAAWDWTKGRFTASQVPTSNVQIERFRRERRDKHDLYRVSGGRAEAAWVGSSRVVAIAEGYRRARMPFLTLEGGLLIRIPGDGYIPLPISSNLSDQCGGLVRVNGTLKYAYPASPHLCRSLVQMFGPGFIEEAMPNPPKSSARSSSIGRFRHNRFVRPGYARRFRV